ncbi:hypothetical protein AVEN_28388-1 [Araneus ventricosus]|uniref:Uncharacterized protein n=1 Tax=Araneus ventricosus TaxID=182803 RepID=A0A4Y2JKQ9_ARAVE|nr:hypothetical protein AVEN_28388-1 [Araneus ventricosus]
MTFELALLSKFRPKPAGGRLTDDADLACSRSTSNDVSLVESSFELGTFRARNRDITTWPLQLFPKNFRILTLLQKSARVCTLKTVQQAG